MTNESTNVSCYHSTRYWSLYYQKSRHISSIHSPGVGGHRTKTVLKIRRLISLEGCYFHYDLAPEVLDATLDVQQKIHLVRQLSTDGWNQWSFDERCGRKWASLSSLEASEDELESRLIGVFATWRARRANFPYFCQLSAIFFELEASLSPSRLCNNEIMLSNGEGLLVMSRMRVIDDLRDYVWFCYKTIYRWNTAADNELETIFIAFVTDKI